jgi:HNH endonuclease
MSEHIPHGVVRVVRARAGRICEYCHLPQILQEAAFHIDHISPRSRKGSSDIDNLALACVTCSLKKAARTHSRDPLSKRRKDTRRNANTFVAVGRRGQSRSVQCGTDWISRWRLGSTESPLSRPKIQVRIAPSFGSICECADCTFLSSCAYPVSRGLG